MFVAIQEPSISGILEHLDQHPLEDMTIFRSADWKSLLRIVLDVAAQRFVRPEQANWTSRPLSLYEVDDVDVDAFQFLNIHQCPCSLRADIKD